MKLRSLKNFFSGFTLVELIVVISVLGVLATIAMTQVSNITLSARNSARMTDIGQIASGLDTYRALHGVVPMPVSPLQLTQSGGDILSCQWQAENTLLSTIKTSGAKDPLDGSFYSYAANKSRTKYQVLAQLEANTSAFWGYLSPTVFAQENSSYSLFSRGDNLWVLLNSGSRVPLALSGVLDIQNTATEYLYYFSSDTSITGTGGKLFYGWLTHGSESGLVAYWDMETVDANGFLQDLSGKWHLGVASGGLVIGNTGGILGKWTAFNYTQTGQSIAIAHAPDLNFLEGTILLSAKADPTTTRVSDRLITKWHDSQWQIYLWKQADPLYSVVSFSTRETPTVYNAINIAFAKEEGEVFQTYGFRFHDNGSRDIFRAGQQMVVNVQKAGSGSVSLTTKNIIIGNDDIGYERSFKGIIDEVRIYSRALSNSEIQAIYSALP